MKRALFLPVMLLGLPALVVPAEPQSKPADGYPAAVHPETMAKLAGPPFCNQDQSSLEENRFFPAFPR
ncbi:MAG TPA: hypothetical protein HPP97_00045 [Desulfuromonadales bacterium]|nr:hypothetical protein [Desulfuromonadales bacterium]